MSWLARWLAHPVAWVLLVGILGAAVYPTGWGAGPSPAPVDATEDAHEAVDLELYQAVVARVRAGERYHAVLGDELRARVFPMRPVFNWRSPAHLSTVAWFPSDGAAAVGLGLLAVGFALVWAPVLDRYGPAVLGLGASLLILTYLPFLNPSGVLFGEVWCGTWLLGALGLRAAGWHRAGVAVAVVALIFRELAGPWIVVMMAFDLVRGRRTVWPWWATGLALWGVYYLAHISAVEAQLRPDDLHDRSWVAFGGPWFVLTTFDFFGPTAWAPRLAPLVVASTIAVSVRSARGPLAELGVGWLVWVGFLMAVGQPFNTYWGCVAAPMVAILLALMAAWNQLGHAVSAAVAPIPPASAG